MTTPNPTRNLSDVVSQIITTLQANQEMLGILDVYYGDQDQVPRTPAVCVEPAELTRPTISPTLYVENHFTVHILIYVSSLEGKQELRKFTDKLSESISEVLHADTTLNGLVLLGYIQKVEAGYNVKQGKMMWATRCEWVGFNKMSLR